MLALRNAYSGSDIAGYQNIATLMATESGSLGTFGSIVVSAQLGGRTSIVSASAAAHTGACLAGTYSATGNSPCAAASAGYYVASA
jgi:hypothetical protein